MSVGKRVLRSKSSCFLPPEEFLCFLGIPDIFSRIHPVVGSRQSPRLLSASDLPAQLFISAPWYNRLAQTMRGTCARSHSHSERRNSTTACLWCWLLCLCWIPVLVPERMIIGGALSRTSLTRFFISPVKPKKKTQKKTKALRQVVNSPEPLKCR